MLEIYQRHVVEHPEAFGRYESGMRNEIGVPRRARPIYKGRDILGANADMTGPSLSFEDVPERCRDDKSDQLIGLLRAFHLTREHFGEGLFWPIDIRAPRSSPKFDVIRESLEQAAATIPSRESEVCYSDGPPHDYECGSGLPEGWVLKLPYLTHACTPELLSVLNKLRLAEPIWRRPGTNMGVGYELTQLEAEGESIENIRRCSVYQPPIGKPKR